MQKIIHTLSCILWYAVDGLDKNWEEILHPVATSNANPLTRKPVLRISRPGKVLLSAGIVSLHFFIGAWDGREEIDLGVL